MQQAVPAPEMNVALSLERFALTTASPTEVKTAISASIPHGSPTAKAAGEIYQAASSWTHLTLRAARQDEGLIEWMHVLCFIAGALESDYKDLAIKVEAFLELIQASATTSRISEEYGNRPHRLPRSLTAPSAF